MYAFLFSKPLSGNVGYCENPRNNVLAARQRMCILWSELRICCFPAGALPGQANITGSEGAEPKEFSFDGHDKFRACSQHLVVEAGR